MPRRLKHALRTAVHGDGRGPLPRVAWNMNCGGSLNGTAKFQTALSPHASDEDRAGAKSNLTFCLLHCSPAPCGTQVTIRALAAPSLPGAPGEESESNQPMKGGTKR
jgi:hypothetical protein